MVIIAVLTLSPGCAIAFALLCVKVCEKVTSSDEIVCDAEHG